MGWFKRKSKDDSDQEQMLRQIAGGGSPVVAPPQTFAPPPNTAPQSFAAPPGQVSSFNVQMPGGLDMQALIAKSVHAIAEHGDQLRARGLDPDQLQRMLEQRMGSMGTFGADGATFVVNGTSVMPSGSAGPDADDLVERLQTLSHLHETGSLSDEEFAAAKAKLLAAG